MTRKTDSFWRDGLSIDETRVSALIVLLYIFSLIAGYTYVTTGDFSTNMLQLLIAVVTAITGVNIAESFVSRMERRRESPADEYSAAEDDKGRPTI